jgi:shikimate kinase
MGAGKSTIGRFISDQLSCPFVDLDKIIEDRAGASIPWIFDIEGEEGFRERETAALDEVLKTEPQVIATGGGCILKPVNQKMFEQGTTVYLVTSIEQQLERTAKDKNRPLLQAEDPEDILANLAQKRNPIYERLADIEVITNSKPPKLVVQEILQQL